MKVKVTKGNGWYSGDEGKIFDVIRTQEGRFGMTEFVIWEGRGGDYNWIDEDDCEIVTE